ncbi:DUF3995 domain-containing protein [Occultella gossypii]|uniref:DUF3995 domain-containing protein n=1 Tax=Occultella gossypii TaxID=2800820 RepID=A0ABS7SG40_9MICO|nr:DUF3995 domain-containing protein [Occultella gossypii]MBZ2198744.1 DUF3995 domain-containing protein [Occultella gossypii]
MTTRILQTTHAPPAVRWAARIGIASLLPYALIKTYWAMGGRAGLRDGFDLATEFRRNGAPEAIIWLERHGIDFTAILALVGSVLLVALIRPWGMRLPRWMVLGPAWAGAAFLVPYGTLTAVVALAGSNDDRTAATTGWLTAAAVAAFCGIGSALAICARSYQRRSAPRHDSGRS